jgi:hypothetical protein
MSSDFEYGRLLTSITSTLKLFRETEQNVSSDTFKLELKSLEKRAERILSMIPLSPNAGAIFSIVSSRIDLSSTTLLRFTNRPATPLRARLFHVKFRICGRRYPSTSPDVCPSCILERLYFLPTVCISIYSAYDTADQRVFTHLSNLALHQCSSE